MGLGIMGEQLCSVSNAACSRSHVRGTSQQRSAHRRDQAVTTSTRRPTSTRPSARHLHHLATLQHTIRPPCSSSSSSSSKAEGLLTSPSSAGVASLESKAFSFSALCAMRQDHHDDGNFRSRSRRRRLARPTHQKSSSSPFFPFFPLFLGGIVFVYVERVSGKR